MWSEGKVVKTKQEGRKDLEIHGGGDILLIQGMKGCVDTGERCEMRNEVRGGCRMRDESL